MAAIMVLVGVLMASLAIQGAFATTFTFRNHCKDKLWIATAQAGPNQPNVSISNYELGVKGTANATVADPWAGRFWARTACFPVSRGALNCATGDCPAGELKWSNWECTGAGPVAPATIVVFSTKLNGGKDTYKVSLVNGFNVPISVTPQGRSGCKSASCPANYLITFCP